MTFRYLLITLLLCGPALAAPADEAGWQKARTPTTALPAAPVPQTASRQNTDVPATQINGDLPAPGQTSPLVEEAASLDSPLSPDEIRELRLRLTDTERSVSAPVVSVVPRISSLTLNLSPGASIPLVRTAMNNQSVVTLTDLSGAPWPQSEAPLNASPGNFDVQYNKGSNMLTITPLRPWAAGNISVYLKGLDVPVIINVTSGETDTRTASQEIDSRLDLRVPRLGPGTAAPGAPVDKIALHDATLQAFLDGIPPKDARRLKFQGSVPDTTIWQTGDDLMVRSRAMLRDEFEQTLSSADGTHLWKLPVTPLLTFSVNGQSVHVTPELE
ncbi:DotH/IcmK family type IV secretion protein [Phytobacter diazotrophicus]|uniref:DotH/IcmK family type IV secretion protein n=1 Tax=Phytobacter diazotrophicus TaxID=395631 RepID=UPI001C98F7C4|nr:DotH/IcmK family type IV secretion protein [Phytobacter diazotrophicus]MBY6260117.1 DotH/IcmK family type IV secretion protein [Phytobacter diazotrophicus]HAV1871919.1 conjugal transfer protein TraN [Enterobacter hormaechei subsp. steigerwaltii]